MVSVSISPFLSKFDVPGIEGELDKVVSVVSSRLARLFGKAVEADELTGWARIGLTKAVIQFEEGRIGPENHRNRVFAYLTRMGKRNAIDAMRASHVIPCRATGTVAIPKATIDDQMCTPADIFEMRDLFVMVFANLSESERGLFQLRCVENTSLWEIANTWGMPYSHVAQMHAEMIVRLRGGLAAV